MGIRRCGRAHEEAWEFFWPEGHGQAKEGYVLHHKDETLIERDPERYNEWRPDDLVMMSWGDHSRLHATGKTSSAEKCRKISEAVTGINNPFYGRRHSEETKRKISEARRRRIAKT